MISREEKQQINEDNEESVLTSIVKDLKDRYPTISGSYKYTPPFGYNLNFSDLELRDTMGDAYPTTSKDDFVWITIRPRRYTKSDSGEYEVYLQYYFGREKLPDKSGRISGPSNNNPRPEVQNIAHKFAESVEFETYDYLGHRGMYTSTVVSKMHYFDTLEQVKNTIIETVVKYIENGRAHPAPSAPISTVPTLPSWLV